MDYFEYECRVRSTMLNLAGKYHAFSFEREMDGKCSQPELAQSVYSRYYSGRKVRYKRVLREVKGQLMQITDRREQYYQRKEWHDSI